MQRVLFLIPSTSYRASDFLDAARRLRVEVVVGSDHRRVLEKYAHGSTLTVSFEPIENGIAEIVEHAYRYPLSVHGGGRGTISCSRVG